MGDTYIKLHAMGGLGWIMPFLQDAEAFRELPIQNSVRTRRVRCGDLPRCIYRSNHCKPRNK